MNETIKRINDLLKKFNATFTISANIVEDVEGEATANGLKIDALKNDGTLFMGEMFDMFAAIIQTVSDEHELVYDVERGLVIAKKQVTVSYVIEED